MTAQIRNPIRFVVGAARRVADFVLPWDVSGGNGQHAKHPIPPTLPPGVQEAGQRTQEVVSDVASHVTRLAGHTAGAVTGTVTAVRERATDLIGAGEEPDQPAAGDAVHGEAVPGAGVAYEEWTKAELYERAQELDIPGRSKMSKAELIEALRTR